MISVQESLKLANLFSLTPAKCHHATPSLPFLNAKQTR